MTDDSKENEDNRERYQYPQLTITLSLHCWVIRGDWKEKLYQHCYQAIQKKKKPSECRTVFLQKEQRAVLTALWGGGALQEGSLRILPLQPLVPRGSLAFGRQQVSSRDPPWAACVPVE